MVLINAIRLVCDGVEREKETCFTFPCRSREDSKSGVHLVENAVALQAKLNQQANAKLNSKTVLRM